MDLVVDDLFIFAVDLLFGDTDGETAIFGVIPVYYSVFAECLSQLQSLGFIIWNPRVFVQVQGNAWVKRHRANKTEKMSM